MAVSGYDVIVVGAGPAGASAARAAARSGVSVLMVDARTSPGTPVQCAEYVPASVWRFAHLDTPLASGAVVQKIDGMRTFVNGGLAAELAAPGYILDRTVFDRSLAEKACEEGAEIRTGSRAVERTGEGILLQDTAGASQRICEVKGRIIIGADGPRSTVGRWMKSENHSFMIGLQYRLPLVSPQSSTDVYFKPDYTGGYAWVFPRGEYANVGVGVGRGCGQELPGLLAEFVEWLGGRRILADLRPVQKTGGLIPTGGPLPVTWRENMLLAGDAAGHTHAVSGGGIMNAMAAGEMAGEAAALAIYRHDLFELTRYEGEWQSLLGRHLARAARQRSEMDRNWTADPRDFAELIRRNWIGFGTAAI